MTDRHQKSLNEALIKITNSQISKWIKDIILYGSCSKGTEKWDSDIDILLILSNDFAHYPLLKKELRFLQGSISSDEIDAPEIDMHVTTESNWLNSTTIYYDEIKKDGISVWLK